MSEPSTRPRTQADWDQRYIDDELPWDSGEPDHHLLRVVEKYRIKPPGKALEIGCGTGTNTLWLAATGFEVTGVDIAPTAISMAQEKAAAAGATCQLLVADFLKQAVPGTAFSFAYDRGCFHSFDTAEERLHFAHRLAGLLAPQGLWHSLIGSTDGPPRDTGPPRRCAGEIVAAIEPDFEILELSSTRFDRGEHAQARAWVLVARKRETVAG